MADPYTGADALGLYETTAGGSAATLVPEQSLGGCRSPREVRGLEALVDGPMTSVIIEGINGAMGEGEAVLSGDDGEALLFTPASGTIGASVAVADGEIAQVVGASASNFIRVRRDGTSGVGDYMAMDCRKAFNNVIGMGNINTTDSAAGISEYRAVMIHAHGPDDVSDIDIFLTPLGTQRVTGSAQLGSSGAGTITTATANGFADWPAQGWAKIVTSGGTLREAVYYTSRTSTSLTVTDDGRELLGTTAAAGAADDVAIPIPGLRLALETPDADGLIQSVADGETAPTSVTWAIPHDAASALNISSIASGNNHGLWIHREIPPGATGTPKQESGITVTHGGYTMKFYGLYRVAQSSLVAFNTYHGIDAFPAFTTPDNTETAAPFTYALSAPVSGVRTHRLVTRYVDQYGVEAFNSFPAIIQIDSDGEQVGNDVSPPFDMSLENLSGGYVKLRAKYAMGVDATNADTFRYYVTTNGVAPTTGGTPIDAAMAIGNGLSSARSLNVNLGPYGYGADVRVLVTAYRSSDSGQSINTTPVQVTVNTVAPAAPALLSAGYAGAFSGGHGWRAEEKTTYFNAPTNTVYLRCSTGMTEFWSGSTLVFRGLYGGDGFYVTYIPEDFTLINGSVSGTGVASAFEVVSVNEIYLCVAGTRRVKFDLTAMEITMATLTAGGVPVDNDNPTAETNFVGSDYTTVQIYDPAAGKWGSLLSCDSSGTLNARVVRQKTT